MLVHSLTYSFGQDSSLTTSTIYLLEKDRHIIIRLNSLYNPRTVKGINVDCAISPEETRYSPQTFSNTLKSIKRYVTYLW